MKDLTGILEKLLYIARFTSEYTALNFEVRYGLKKKFYNLPINFTVFAECNDDYLLCTHISRTYANTVNVIDKYSGEVLIMVRVPAACHKLLTDPKNRSSFFSTTSASLPSMFVSETFINTRLVEPSSIKEFNGAEWVLPESDYRLMEEDEYFMYTLTKSIPPYIEFKYITDSINAIPKYESNDLNQSIEIAVNAKNGVADGLYDIDFLTSSVETFCDKMHESFPEFSKGFIILE